MTTLAKAALKHFSVIRSVIPTSKKAVEEITNTVRKTHREIRSIIVEYGPGTGEVTEALLEKGMLATDGRLIAIELVEELANHMKKTISDTRLTVISGDAQDTPKILEKEHITEVDQVFSGIPFSIFSDSDAETIIRQTYDMLNPGGVFVVYQVKRDIETLLQEHFDQVSTKRVWWNFPPLYLFVAGKKKTAASTL